MIFKKAAFERLFCARLPGYPAATGSCFLLGETMRAGRIKQGKIKACSTRVRFMSKAKLHAATMGGSADDTEAAFYEALHNGDIDKLMACWADEDDVVCVHPGGLRVVGVAAVRTTFEAMFAQSSIRATPLQVRKVESLGSAMHNVVESIEVMTADGPRQAFAIATNVYHKTAQGWRMVAHHASPGTGLEMQESSGAPQVLH
jgi:ketosteroid isomerase-like protein